MCKHYNQNQCDCMNGICFSFKEVENPTEKKLNSKLRFYEIKYGRENEPRKSKNQS